VAFNTSMRAFGGTDYNISSTYLSPDDGSNSTNFHWQLFPVTPQANGSYVLRPRNVPGGFLNAVHDYNSIAPKCVTIAGVDCTTTTAIRPSVDLNAVWTFTETFDGTGSVYMTNSQNGTGYRIDLWCVEVVLACAALRLMTDLGIMMPISICLRTLRIFVRLRSLRS